jgi:hypothetical protein
MLKAATKHGFLNVLKLVDERLSHLFPLGATYSLLHTTCQQKRLEFVRLFSL